MATKVKLIADGVITPDQITLTTASTGTNTTAPATTAFVQQEISALVDSSPDALNTLNELAAALGDDENFSTTVTDSIATKLPLAGGTMTGALTVTADANPALEISRGSANTTNVNLKYNTTLTGQLSAANAEFQISAAGSSTPMEFFTNGSERMRIDSSGNAIFTKSGGAYLQLKDASAVRGAINVGTSDGLVFTTGSSFAERMRIDSSGNVGIGTGSDTLNGILNVKGGVNSIAAYSTTTTDQPGLFVGNNSAYDTSTNTLYAKIYGSGISASSFGVTLADYAIVATEGTDNNGLLIGSFNSAPVIFGTNNTERMRINSSGNVLIGGTSATFGVLGVESSSNCNVDFFSNSGSSTAAKTELFFSGGISGNSHVSLASIVAQQASGDEATRKGELRFLTANSSGPSTRMIIKADGEVKFQDKIEVGSFTHGQTNTGEAWLGRAADRNEGTLTVQLGGGTTGRKFEIVDHDWQKVLVEIDGHAEGGSLVIPATEGGSTGIIMRNRHPGNAEPYTSLDVRELQTTNGYGGIGMYSNLQSHLRFKTGGGATTWGNGTGHQWQLRMGNGAAEDQMEFYAWTGNKRVQRMYGSNGAHTMEYQLGGRFGLPSNQTVTTSWSNLNFSDTNSTWLMYNQGLTNSSGEITVPVAGRYAISARFRTEATPFQAPTQIAIYIDNSGSGSGTFVQVVRLYITSNTQSSYEHAPPLDGIFNLVAGARFVVRAISGSGSFVLSSTSNTVNHLTVMKLA